MATWLDTLKFNDSGLIPAIAQDRQTGQILMMAWQNREALLATLHTGQAVYFSRSRGKLWHKGETSGHFQHVHEIRTDCDDDVIVLVVTQVGGIACHTGRPSCFYKTLDVASGQWQETATQTLASTQIVGELDRILAARKLADKDSSYVASLYHKGLNKILEKVGEETTEFIIAAKDAQVAQTTGDATTQSLACVTYEMADVWFHGLVALHALGLSGQQVQDELARRFGLSGIDEKNARTTGE